jgi:hypothetical protein
MYFSFEVFGVGFCHMLSTIYVFLSVMLTSQVTVGYTK